MQTNWRSFKFIDNAERAAFIWLSAVPGIGRSALHKLMYTRIKHNHDFGLYLGTKGHIYAKSILSENQIQSIKKYQIEHKSESFEAQLLEQGIQPITIFDDNYPDWLKQTDDPPLVLYYKGPLELMAFQRWIAIVGTRRMTSYGKQATEYLVSDLVAYGWGVVSGAMYGIDTAAHRACLDAGGKTLAVLGYGFGHTPNSAAPLITSILATGGGILSEFPPEIPAKPGHFPLRNRIVTGLNQAVVVVEAAKKSGSHITAQCGLDAGLVVAAVPGPITSPYSQGTTWLLNQGAVCIGSAADLLSELHLTPGKKSEEKQQSRSSFPFGPRSLERKIYDMLLTQPCSTQVLASQLAVPVAQLITVLSTLEIAGFIDRTDTMWSIVL